MATDNTPPLRARPSKYANRPAAAPRRPSRMAFRLLGLPVLAVAAVYLFYGLRDYLSLPACDSDRAQKSLAAVLKGLNLEPTRYEPVQTVSSGNDEVVCNAVLPLPNGGSVTADFTFYWEGSKANMRYTVSKKST